MPSIAAEDLVPKFEAEFSKVGGTAHRASAPDDLNQIIRGILTTSAATAVVMSRSPLLARLGLADRLRALGLSVTVWSLPSSSESGGMDEQSRGAHGQSTDDSFREQCFRARVGITGVDFALAESGSLVLSSVTEGSQLASLAPPVHVALYTRSQVLGSLEEVLERMSPIANPGRSVVFITGTSRTADIEQILIRGVHGPGEVHAILVEDSCLT